MCRQGMFERQLLQMASGCLSQPYVMGQATLVVLHASGLWNKSYIVVIQQLV